MLETILNHRTIRKYKKTPIHDSVMQSILLAASRASTTGNMQVYSIVVTSGEELRKQLWEAHFKQNMVLQAPTLLTFCADFNRFVKWCEYRNATAGYDNYLSFFTAAIDALLASQNATLAAEQQGLGVCYLGTTTYMADKIIDILKLPKLVVPITTLVVGYPDESPELTDRLPVEAIVHNETYTDYNCEMIDAYYAEKESLELTSRLIAENKTENLAQIFTDKRYTKKDNVFFSKRFLDVIEKQGFMNNE